MSGSELRSLVSGPRGCAETRRSVNRDLRSRPQAPQQIPERIGRERDAAGGRRPVRPRHMHEHCAAAAGDPRPDVVIHLDDEVVEAIVPPEPVAWFIGRPPEWAVIAAVRGIFAPCQVGRDPPRRQKGRGPRGAVGPPPQAESRKRPRGVPPSPSRLLARMPDRPRTTGIASGPASSTPRRRSPGRVRTRITENERRCIALPPRIGVSQLVTME